MPLPELPPFEHVPAGVVAQYMTVIGAGDRLTPEVRFYPIGSTYLAFPFGGELTIGRAVYGWPMLEMCDVTVR